MSAERLYDLASISKATAKTLQAITARANKGRKGNKNHPPETPWPVHTTETRRGQPTRLYAYADLPADIQQALDAWEKEQRRLTANALINRHAAEIDAEDARAAAAAQPLDVAIPGEVEQKTRMALKHQAAAEFAALKDSAKKKRARAKSFALSEYRDYCRTHGLKKIEGANAFCEAVRQREVTFPERYSAHLPHLHDTLNIDRATLLRWEKKQAELGLMGLVDNYGVQGPRSKVECNPDLKQVVLGSLIKYPHITGLKIKEYLAASHPSLNVLSTRALQRYLTKWKRDNAQIWTYMINPDRWKNVYMSALGSHTERIVRLNQVWELDSTPGDWMLTDGRHSVLGIIDLFSRRMKLLVSKTSKATAVCQVMRRAILDWGICEAARTDNGKDYVSNQMEEVLQALEIVHEICIPFASEEKGTIERGLGTMSHGMLDLLEGFIGHNVAERKEIEARKSFAQRVMQKDAVVEVTLSSSELQERLDQWTDHVYAHNPHAGLGGKTPWQVASEWNQPLRRIDNPRALDALLAEVAGTRTVTKQGIRFENHTYIHPVLPLSVGKAVHLKRDEHELGLLYVYQDDAFLCIAACPELADISRQEWAVIGKQSQKKFMTQQAKELRQFKKDLTDSIPEVVLQHRIEQSQKLAAFPKASQTHTTSGLEAAAAAASARDGKPRSETTDEQNAAREKVVREMREPATVSQLETPVRVKMARWFALDNRIKQGDGLGEDEYRFWSGFSHTADYKAQLVMIEDFGMEAMGYAEARK